MRFLVHVEQLEKLVQDPNQVRNAIVEALRDSVDPSLPASTVTIIGPGVDFGPATGLEGIIGDYVTVPMNRLGFRCADFPAAVQQAKRYLLERPEPRIAVVRVAQVVERAVRILTETGALPASPVEH